MAVREAMGVAVVGLAQGGEWREVREVVFVDGNEGLFDARDSPRTELYLEDGLHFRPAAYREVFGPAVRNAIERVRASSRG